MAVEFLCTCGHSDADHVCSMKAHENLAHICNETDRTFCIKDSMEDPTWGCRCVQFMSDNLLYLEMLERDSR